MKKKLSKIFIAIIMIVFIAGCSSTSSKKSSSVGVFGGIFTSSKPQKAQHTDADYELDYSFFKQKGLPIPDNFKGKSVEYLVPGNDVLKEHGYSFFKKYDEKEILKLRYGLDGYEIHTLEEIGNTLNITRERVRQIEKKTLQKLRSKYTKELKGDLF